MKFQKRPVVIEAEQYDGSRESASAIARWAHAGLHESMNSIVLFDGVVMTIRTLEGVMLATPGDWIIKGIKGEFYPCKPDIFEASYLPVE